MTQRHTQRETERDRERKKERQTGRDRKGKRVCLFVWFLNILVNY